MDLAYSFLGAYVLLVTRECIGQYIPRARTVYDREIELSEYLSPTGLVLVELFGYYEVLKCLIVRLDTYYSICTHLVRSPLLEALNDSK